MHMKRPYCIGTSLVQFIVTYLIKLREFLNAYEETFLLTHVSGSVYCDVFQWVDCSNVFTFLT